MSELLHYYAHPGHIKSRTNSVMNDRAAAVTGITKVDLFADYPRYNIDIDKEQARLLAHDVILFQFPLFWYSCPALMKEWIDLVLEHGFAFGENGDKLKDKLFVLAITTGGPQDAYAPDGYQLHALQSFLTPFQQTARLCQMRYVAPYVQYDALRQNPAAHADGFATLLKALRDDQLDLDKASAADVLTHDTLPLIKGA